MGTELSDLAAIAVGVAAAVTRSPFTDASSAEIRAALIPEEQPRFDREYRQALEVAAETFSLDELDKTLASWRRIAWLCTDPDRYRRMWRRAAELYTREEVPPQEALPITRPGSATDPTWCTPSKPTN